MQDINLLICYDCVDQNQLIFLRGYFQCTLESDFICLL